MNQDILLSKIVPNATDTTWSQAYTTLNVYITVSIESPEGTANIGSTGKELLEKLQREFFALDDKSLENIKTAVANVTKTIEENVEYSIIVGAIVKDVLYLVIGSRGEVAIKRNGQVGVIAKGEKGELIGFSGRLKHDDIVILQTGDFAEKIPFATLREYLSEQNILTISENITPLVHEASKGTESAIIIQYKNLDNITSAEDEEDIEMGSYNRPKMEEEDEKLEKEEQMTTGDTEEDSQTLDERRAPEHAFPTEEEDTFLDTKPTSEKKRIALPSVNFAFLKRLGSKRTMIMLAVVLLVGLLVGSIILQRISKAGKEREQKFEAIYSPSQKKFDEASALLSLNKSLALNELVTLQKTIKESLIDFDKKSEEYKKLSELLSQVDSKIEEIGGGSGVKNQKEIVKGADQKELKSIDAISFQGGQLIAVDGVDKLVATFDNDGKLKKSYDTDKTSGKHIVGDETYMYVLGDSIAKIDKGNGKSETIIENVTGSEIEVFGSNIYVLDSNDINKYRAPSYEPASYFVDSPSFSGGISSITINGPVYVLESGGKLSRFSKGKVEGFEVKGLQAPFGENSQIYTDDDFSNLYILDKKNERIVVLSDSGEFQTQYESSEFKNAKSFAIDEKGKKGFFLSNNSIFSFDL